MAPEETYHWIDQYLNGELQGEELDVFRIKMKNDPDFAYDVHIQELIRSQLMATRKNELKQFLSENAKVEYYGNLWDKKWLYASAAIVIVFVVSFFVIEYLVKPSQQSANRPPLVKEQPIIAPPDKAGSSTPDSTADSTVLPFEENELSLALEESPINNMPEADNVIVDEDLEDDGLPDEVSKVLEGPVLESIDIEDKDVRKDEKISEKLVKVEGISLVSNRSETEKEQETKGLFGRRKKAEEDSNTPEEELQISQESIKVEFWKSPVNFNGYKLSGNTLILFGVDLSEVIVFKRYQNVLYMKRNGSWFTLTPNNSGNKFTRTTNIDILNVLNQ